MNELVETFLTFGLGRIFQRTEPEFKVSPVIGRQFYFNVNDLTRCVTTSLKSGGVNSARFVFARSGFQPRITADAALARNLG